MSQLAQALTAAATVGAVSEATGTTAFTPLGERARQQQDADGGGRGPSFDLDLGDRGASQDVLARLAAELAEQQAGDSAAVDALAEGRQRLLDLLEEQQERTEEWRDEAMNATDGGGVDLDEWKEWLEEQQAGGDGDSSSGDSSSGDGDDFKLQHLAGTGPFGVGTIVAAGAEGLNAAGDAAGATVDAAGEGVDFLTRVGNTYGQTARALAGKEYTAEDTLAESIHGTGTRRINREDYIPSLDLDLPELPEQSDEQLGDKTKERIKSAISRDDDEEEPIAGLEEAQRRLTAGV